MGNPTFFLVAVIVLVCGYTSFSFFRRAFEVNAVFTKSTSKSLVKAVQFRYNLIMGAIMAVFTVSGLIWVFTNV